jgi:hypothetical protein
MSDLEYIKITWQPREIPLAPVAAAAVHDVARALAQRLMEMDDESLAQLRGAVGPQFIIVMGDAQNLPWVNGIVYLGRSPAAPSLLLPTALEPDAPVALLERAVARRLPNSQLTALLTDPFLLAPVAVAQPIARDALRTWMEASS